MKQWEIPVENLKPSFKAEKFPFETTKELPPIEEVIGQERAVRAMDFGLQIQDRGYNIYVSGIPGTGKSTLAKAMVERVAKGQPTPEDWCYVNNFQDPDRPRALSLPAGKGRELQRDMDRLIDCLREEFPKVFQSKEYEDQRRSFEEEFTRARDSLTRDLEEAARESGFQLKTSRLGIAVIPVHQGKPLSPEQIEALEPSVRTEFQRREKALHDHLHAFAQKVRILRDELDRKLEDLNRKVAQYTSDHFIEKIRDKYREFPEILDHVRAVQEDLLQNFKDFLPAPETAIQIPGIETEPSRKSANRYAVNVMVDNGGREGAPVVEETNPTYSNLVGRIEKKGRFGHLYTDFTLVKAGSVLQANGGYLVVHALDLLRSPFSWDAVKRIIKNRQLKIEDLGESYGLIATAGIKPEPIPVRLRVVMVGSPYVFYLLQTYDEDFGQIFKVKVDFGVHQKRTEESPLAYARFVSRLCQEEGLKHFDRLGVAALMEQVARWANHQSKLSVRFSDLANLVREASFWAGQEEKELVSKGHVDRAVAEKIYRSNLLEEYVQDLIAEGTLMVDVSGSVVGQVNGLSVHSLGDFSFGRPSRITARVFMGRSGIVDIEREAKLSGKTHSKGVMILSGYLGGRYAHESPLSLSATLCFEQSYGEVEGDSASAAELIALLSALSDIPLRQGVAITGSVNQRGEMQAVGGINEKIEGYYAVCKSLGLSGEQGVIIPRQNVKHLTLRDEVVAAAASGRFHVYGVSTVNEALEILTGRAAGEMQADGTYPQETVNAEVLKRLKEMGEKMKALEGRKGGVLPPQSSGAVEEDLSERKARPA